MIDLNDLIIDNHEYTGKRDQKVSKYEPLFVKLKQGQRIACPPGKACGAIANNLRKWLQGKGHANPDIRTKRECEDGKGGVWWMGEQAAKEAKPAKPKATKHAWPSVAKRVA